MRINQIVEGSRYKCTCHPGDADPDCPVHGLEPMEVGDALDVKPGVAEGANDTIYPNATVIKSRNGKPVGEIYQDESGWGCFHYKADRGADCIESKEEALEWLKDIAEEYRQDRSLEEGWTKLPSGDYQNSHTGVRTSKPPVKKKRGEKTGAEWDAIKAQQEKGVAEGHADQQRKIFKKNGHPVGEVGIDRESSPGVGQWYMKYYATGDDFSGYDSMEEAVADLKHLVSQFKAEGSLNEFAAGDGGGSGNYFQELASAWYNGTYNTGSLQKGIKSQQDVERLLNRGIVGPDGVTRKYAIDYNSDFDGVVISSDDYYEHSDYGDAGGEVDSRTGQPWGPYDYMEFRDEELDEGVAEGSEEGNLYAIAIQRYPQLKQVDRETVINALNNAYEDYLMHYGYEGIGPDEESSMIDHAVKGLKQGMAESDKKPEPPEADYGADYQAMVSRVKKLAGLGPLKTVYDPAKRVYKNVPTAVQPKK